MLKIIKKYKFIFAFIFVLIVSLLYFAISQNKRVDKQEELENQKQTMPTPYQSNFEQPKTEQISVSNVSVNNFYNYIDQEGKLGEARFVDGKDYNITYYPKDDAFLITILSTPFEEVRIDAENQFLQSLGISEKEACKLEVWINTPNHVNPDYAGKYYELSFCQ